MREDYLVGMLAHYQQRSNNPILLVRGDSGFAKPKMFDCCEIHDQDHEVRYVIKLKNNVRLIDQARHIVLYQDGTDDTQTEHQYFMISYRADSWRHVRSVAIQTTRPAGQTAF